MKAMKLDFMTLDHSRQVLHRWISWSGARVSLARAKQKGKMREAMRAVFGSVLMVAKAT